jgi:LacI family transcriptional regulator
MRQFALLTPRVAHCIITIPVSIMERVTMRDVAQTAGVSVNTVSRALAGKPDVSPETRAKVLEVAQELDYRPNRLARGLRSNKTEIIGVIVGDIANPFFSTVVQGMGKRAKDLGYGLILQDTGEDYENEEEAVRIMQYEQVDGILLTPAQTDNRSVKMLQELGIQFVLVARYFADIDTDFVVADDAQGGYLATAHLIERGHKRVAFVNGPSYNSSAKERLEGYTRALREHGIAPDPNLIRTCALTMEDGYACAREILAQARLRPTAFFAFSDFVALGIMQALKEEGIKVPRDMAVVGYDDIAFASCLEVPLTTVRMPKREMGEKALEILVEKLGKKEATEPYRVKMPVELVVRESS